MSQIEKNTIQFMVSDEIEKKLVSDEDIKLYIM
jgi:hypothetical protein